MNIPRHGGLSQQHHAGQFESPASSPVSFLAEVAFPVLAATYRPHFAVPNHQLATGSCHMASRYKSTLFHLSSHNQGKEVQSISCHAHQEASHQTGQVQDICQCASEYPSKCLM